MLDGLYYEFLTRLKKSNEDKWYNQLLPILHALSISYDAINEIDLAYMANLNPYDLRQNLFELKPFIQEKKYTTKIKNTIHILFIINH
ncbi:MAG: hypothetical protein ABJB76_12090 [Candidatus Nitrosocosmicus sp.]